jgi:hypothetical protein
VPDLTRRSFLATLGAGAARSFSAPLPPAEMDRLRRQYAINTVGLGTFFAHHHDDGAWTA